MSGAVSRARNAIKLKLKTSELLLFGHDIIVIGDSAGGVDALPKLIGSLPENLPASVFVVVHIPAQGPDFLPQIIRRDALLSVHHGIDGEKIRHGHVYTAPPDYHLMLEGQHVRLARGPRENFHRPAIDTLFRAAAESYAPRVVGVSLTGNLDVGTAGLHAVKSHGGIAIVQDPKEALVPAMTQSALRNVKVDHCVPLAEMRRFWFAWPRSETYRKARKEYHVWKNEA